MKVKQLKRRSFVNNVVDSSFVSVAVLKARTMRNLRNDPNFERYPGKLLDYVARTRLGQGMVRGIGYIEGFSFYSTPLIKE